MGAATNASSVLVTAGNPSFVFSTRWPGRIAISGRTTWRLFTALAYLVLFVSVLAYLLWFRMLTVSGATAASSYHFMMPPLGLLFGWLLLGEHPRTSLASCRWPSVSTSSPVRGHSAVMQRMRSVQMPAREHQALT